MPNSRLKRNWYQVGVELRTHQGPNHWLVYETRSGTIAANHLGLAAAEFTFERLLAVRLACCDRSKGVPHGRC